MKPKWPKKRKIVDTNSKVQNWSRLLFTGATSYIDVHLYKFSQFYSTFEIRREPNKENWNVGPTAARCNRQHEARRLVWGILSEMKFAWEETCAPKQY